jgi:hypothetical protein
VLKTVFSPNRRTQDIVGGDKGGRQAIPCFPIASNARRERLMMTWMSRKTNDPGYAPRKGKPLVLCHRPLMSLWWQICAALG